MVSWKGIVERISRKTEGENAISQSFSGGVRVDQVGPPKAELGLARRRFGAVVGNGATFIAPVTAYPTTTATFMLYNGEPDGGRVLSIETASFFQASGTSDANGILIGAVTLARQTTVPGAYANTVLSSLSGGPVDSKAVLANNHTITGGQPAWLPLPYHGSNAIAADADDIGSHQGVAKVDGEFNVPPGHGFALVLVAGAGSTPLYGYGVTWAELDAPLS
tara:strand:- start:3369 stop:4031 length:663 start_codon:yes stop_codon:yes gene_type:complete